MDFDWYKCPHCSTCLNNHLKFQAHRRSHFKKEEDSLGSDLQLQLYKQLFYITPNAQGVPIELLNLPKTKIQFFIPKIELKPIETDSRTYLLPIKPCQIILVKIPLGIDDNKKNGVADIVVKPEARIKNEPNEDKLTQNTSFPMVQIIHSTTNASPHGQEPENFTNGDLKLSFPMIELVFSKDESSKNRSKNKPRRKRITQDNNQPKNEPIDVSPIKIHPKNIDSENISDENPQLETPISNEFNLRSRQNRVNYAVFLDTFSDSDNEDTRILNHSKLRAASTNRDKEFAIEELPEQDPGFSSPDTDSASDDNMEEEYVPAPKMCSRPRKLNTKPKAKVSEVEAKIDVIEKSDSDSQDLEKESDKDILPKPHFMCNICGNDPTPTFPKYLLLLSHMQRLHHKYDPDSSYPCLKCDYKAKGLTAVKSILLHYLIRHELLLEDKLKCYLCQPNVEFHDLYGSTKETQYNFHLKAFHQYPISQNHSEPHYFCTYCGKSKLFYDVTLLTKHLLVEHEIPRNWTMKSKTMNLKGKKYPCKHCGRKLETESKLFSHMKKWCKTKGTSDLPFRCTVCKKGYSARKSLRYHINIHRPDNPYICKVCLFPFSCRRALDRHIEVKHLETPLQFPCPHCKNIYTRRERLRYHIIRCHPKAKHKPVINVCYSKKIVTEDSSIIEGTPIKEEPFEQESEPLSANDNPELELRLPKEPTGQPTFFEKKMMDGPSIYTNATKPWDENRDLFKCPYCIRSYSRCVYLTRHFKSEHPDKVQESNPNLICQHCGLNCESEAKLEKHKKVHFIPVKCRNCGLNFPNQSQLIRHFGKCHDAKKPQYKCQDCGKTYTKKERLNTHQERLCPKNDNITKEPYKCGVCGRVLATLKSYRYHMDVIHSGKRKFVYCQVCNDRFGTPASLKKHVERVHRKDYIPENLR